MKSKNKKIMNDYHMSVKYSIAIFFLLATLMLPASLNAQVERTKTFKKNFSGKQLVEVSHRHGPLIVKKSTDGQLRIDAAVKVIAKDESDAEAVLKYFDVEVKETGNEVSIITDLSIKNWNNSNGRIDIRFDDGKKVNDLKDLDVKFILYVPQLKQLKVGNRYDDIEIEEGVQADVIVKLYSGRLKAGNLSGNLGIDAKYSKAKVGNYKEGKFELYDCEMEFGDGEKVRLTSKYSELTFGSLAEINMETYDDKISGGNVKSNLFIKDKYSDFKFGNFANGKFDLYDANLNVQSGNSAAFKSKYSKIIVKSVDEMQFEVSYDDQVTVEQTGSLVATTSKYTKYQIGTLKKKLSIQSYDDKISIDQFSGPLEGVTINGKYTNVDFNLKQGTAFKIEANLKYSKLNLDLDNFDYQKYIEKNDKVEFEGTTKGAGSNVPTISLDCYDCNFKWK